jgi:uncharacterized protein (DUF58 family)
VLLDPALVRKLDALRLQLRQMVVGSVGGPRRAVVQGASVEFSDYRNYTPGDDFRRIDWNAYARLERLFLRLYHAEETLTLHLLLDRSASMGFGRPPKLALAARLAGALGYIALSGLDRVSAAGLSDRLDPFQPALSGQATVGRLWDFLANLAPGGTTDLAAAVRQLSRHRPPPGLAILFSDLLSPHGYADGLRALRALRQEVVLVHVLAPEEREPHLSGDWRLVDAETEAAVELTADSRVLRAYRARLAAFLDAVRAYCSQHGITYVPVSSDEPVEELVLRRLALAGVVR